MNPKLLTRDPAKVKAVLKKLPDKRLVTTKGCKIVIPARFAERGLASIGSETHIVGIYAMVVEDKYYAVSMVNAMMRLEPTSTARIMIEEDEYIEFSFEPGATVMSTVMLMKVDTLVYKIFDELISKARVPWYITYDDLGNIFGSARYHGGANVGENQEVTELLVSLISRDPSNRNQSYRNSIKSEEDVLRKPPVYIPLRTVQAASNPLNRMVGSYFKDGLVSALVNPTDKVEPLDDLLRR